MRVTNYVFEIIIFSRRINAIIWLYPIYQLNIVHFFAKFYQANTRNFQIFDSTITLQIPRGKKSIKIIKKIYNAKPSKIFAKRLTKIYEGTSDK